MTLPSKLKSEMKQLCADCDVDFVEPDWKLKVGISDGVLTGAEPINGLRHAQEHGTLGWYLYSGESFPTLQNSFSPLCAEHLFEQPLQWLKFLALPVGWRFLVDHSGYEDVWFDEDLLEPVQ